MGARVKTTVTESRVLNGSVEFMKKKKKNLPVSIHRDLGITCYSCVAASMLLKQNLIKEGFTFNFKSSLGC